jgi:hypothetical protein
MAGFALKSWWVGFVASGAITFALSSCGSSDTAETAISEPPASPAPPAAAQVGYMIHTFSSTFTTATVDTAVTGKPGFQWYNCDIFGVHSDPAAVVINSDGSVTLNGDNTGCTGELVTAVQPGSAPFVGHSFGGGAYIEAKLNWQPLPGSATNAAFWPAFWALPIEGNMAPYTNQWPGQPQGYAHEIEADFFEALPVDAGTNSYGGGLHDWYGIYDVTCAPQQECQVTMPYSTGQRTVPAGTHFTQYHRYGFLWVPATSTSMGYAQFFFDDVQVGYTYEWELLGEPPPPPTNQPWAFGILDQQHLFIILGTGQSQPMTVQSVDVWQSDASEDIQN